MPAKQRVRRRDGGDLTEGRTAHAIRADGETTTLVVRNVQPSPAKLLSEDPVLFDEVREGVPLLMVQPVSQRHQHHLQRREVDHAPELQHGRRTNVGRGVKHNA